jgi:hypothetical protein
VGEEMNRVGFLVFLPEKRKNKPKKAGRKHNNYFDFHANAGANVVIELLENRGIEIDFCSAATAHKYEVVLTSFTSTYDVFAFYKEVGLRPEWQRKNRKFKVIAGGFGMLNPTTIRNQIDYAVFGRAEDFVVDLVETVLGGGEYEHESVMRMPEISVVKFAQASKLLNMETFKENAIGCSHKCKFCLYSWTRRFLGGDAVYIRGGEEGSPYSPYNMKSGKVSIEIMMKGIKDMTQKYGFTRSALDGCSTRLRYLYGKKISNDEFVEAINHLGTFDGAKFLNLFNIVNFPTETDEDRGEMFEVMKRANPKNTVVIRISNNPFNPQPCTPMQYSPVTLFPDHSKNNLTTVLDRGTLGCRYNLSESPLSQLKTAIIGRATEESDTLFHTICFSSKFRNAARDYRRLKMLQKNFDLTPYTREYHPDEERHPGWFLRTYLPQSALRKAYLWTKEREGNTEWMK